MTLDALGTIQCVSEVDASRRESGLAGLTMKHVERGVDLALRNGWVDAAEAHNILQFAQENLHGAWGFLSFVSRSNGHPMTLETIARESVTCMALTVADMQISSDVRSAFAAILRDDPSHSDFSALDALTNSIRTPRITSAFIDQVLGFGVQREYMSASQAEGMRARAQHDAMGLLETYSALVRDFLVTIDVSGRVMPRYVPLLSHHIATCDASVTDDTQLKGTMNIVAAFQVDRLAQMFEIAAHIRNLTRADLGETHVLADLFGKGAA